MAVKKRARPENFFCARGASLLQNAGNAHFTREKNLHKPLAFAQAFATLVVVSSN